jgi:Fe-S-cluster-containing dehydrogenase component
MSDGITRRAAILSLAGLGATGAAAAHAEGVEHPAHPEPAPDAVALLYDNTICTGCKACMSACNEANDLPADTSLSGGLWHMPPDLDSRAKNIIEVFEDPDGQSFAFVKRQCMHCLDPACVTGCPLKALVKNRWGAVTWDGSLCIGCRYCEVACPFDVPKFEWDRWNPKIVKCEFCFESRLKLGRQPACTEVCPTGAVIFGKRTEMLAAAKARVAASPGKYCEDRVYGEHEAGGTQALYLSSVPFEKIGLPRLGSTSLGYYATKVTSVIYKWLSGPLLVAGLLGVRIKRNWDHHVGETPEPADGMGLPENL